MPFEKGHLEGNINPDFLHKKRSFLRSSGFPSRLAAPGREKLQRTKTYGFVPFSPHMSPKTDGKPKQTCTANHT